MYTLEFLATSGSCAVEQFLMRTVIQTEIGMRVDDNRMNTFTSIFKVTIRNF